MNNCIVNSEIIEKYAKKFGIKSFGAASIREIVQLINYIEEESGVRYVRMEMGVPGLTAVEIAVTAQIEALKSNVDAVYPLIDGWPELKKQTSSFLKNFADIDVPEECCIPTAGSMQGTYAAFLLAPKMNPQKDTALFIDPGFPVQKMQMQIQGNKFEAFDIYQFRGENLKAKLESYLIKGNINSIIYSSPNNPTWITFTEDELKVIAELAEKYDVIVMEDLAYFGLDFRIDISTPGVPPYQPSIAKYTDNWMIFLSGSKMFSYAGPRCAMLIISEKLWNREYSGLLESLGVAKYGRALVYKALYPLSAGVNNSAQRGLSAIFKACNEGKFNFVEYAREYSEKAKLMKAIFLKHNFHIIYDKDGDAPIGDGFYFTIGYPAMVGDELLSNLIHYGISAISLSTTGSTRDGVRACVSHVYRDQFDDLDKRLEQFTKDFPIEDWIKKLAEQEL